MRPKEEEVLIDSKLQERYRSVVGMLLYLIKYIRPDITNAVREHSKMMDNLRLFIIWIIIKVDQFCVRYKRERTKNESKEEWR